MKKIMAIIICVLVLAAIPTYGRVSKEYIRWANGVFEIPVEIQEANDISDLQLFLDDKDEFTRMAAVRRLGEVEGSRAVSLLREIFTNEPPTRGLDIMPLVRLEVIRTLGRVGGDDAKSSLLLLLNSYWEAGPQVKDKKYFYHDRDFEPVVSLILEELYNWNNDDNVFQAAKKIAFSEATINYYAHRIANKAWVLYLKGYMAKQGVNSGKNSAKYLLDFIEDLSEGGVAYGKLEAVKKDAAQSLFKKHGEEVLYSLQKDIEEEFEKAPRDPNGALSKGHNRLRRQISYIKKVLKEKADKRKTVKETKKQKAKKNVDN